MPQENPKVKCSVSNCEYWDQGNNCGADVIMIEIDKHARMNFKEEFAGEAFDSEHKDEAGNSSSTCCHTFKPKAAGQ
ncbi:DUF1540 domain-containing protein [Paenibacillus alkalitolerans]|uniref:DUF1540 domain-containing protein n=1 Tax=Paenibacillus alkalitolerans TaxID=2799335 RepID=UPI0018F65FEC|nr:DUF1540 domain-containing protein [Paenibacillus alkalitolerans]